MRPFKGPKGKDHDQPEKYVPLLTIHKIERNDSMYPKHIIQKQTKVEN